MNSDWYRQPAASPCQRSRGQAEDRQQQLTKPPGSLGQLESLAIKLAGLQKTATPRADAIAISIFAADHGIAAEGVSAFPQAVTAEMVRNFAGGGAAIAVLARHLNARLRVANLGTVAALEPVSGVDDCRIAAGTANFMRQPAMTAEQLQTALAIGRQHADAAASAGCDLFIGGEMGIANTCSASALAGALLQQPIAELVGLGTGVDPATHRHKQQVIEQALQYHALTGAPRPDPITVLQTVGGFEIAALTGAYIRAAQTGIPALVDGFIASVAALIAAEINPGTAPWLILTHQSVEPGHRCVIDSLVAEHALSPPLIKLDMRLGEASGAATVVPLLQMACRLHNNMATFADAGVSNRETPD